MSITLIYTIISLCVIGIAAAVILYLVAQKFKVDEDPRIAEVEEALPAANCGGCGYPGCRAFAEACVKAETLEGLFCTPGGNGCMEDVARILGKTMSEVDPRIAVVRCNGTPDKRAKTSDYDGAQTCAVSALTYGGDTGCSYGCLGLGDCEAACPFDAIHINKKTLLPEVIVEKCVGCGNCVRACPKDIIELRNKGLKGRRVWVSCINQDKGGVALKACKAACIGCGKCVKECPFDAITLENNLAYIDDEKCKLCRKCVSICPTGAILEVNFPVKKEKVDIKN